MRYFICGRSLVKNNRIHLIQVGSIYNVYVRFMAALSRKLYDGEVDNVYVIYRSRGLKYKPCVFTESLLHGRTILCDTPGRV